MSNDDLKEGRMPEMSRHSLSRLAIVVVSALVCCGCLEYKETITFNKDGSGSVEITLSIQDSVASSFLSDEVKASGKIPPPLREPSIRSQFYGSKSVFVSTCVVPTEPENGVWKYHVKAEFDSVGSLSVTKYFKQRALLLAFSGPKELHFREDFTPSLLTMTTAEAKNLANDPYASSYLASVDAPDFAKTIQGAKLTHEVVVPGERAVQPVEGMTEVLPGGFIKVSRDFQLTDFLNKNARQYLDVKTVQPQEEGFTPVVVVLLLLSIVGILVPALRLLLLKVQGGA
jgi:hypothetical protein